LLDHLHRAPAAEAALLRAVALDPSAVPARKKLCDLYYNLSARADFAAQFRALEEKGQLVLEDVILACNSIRNPGETKRIVERLKEFLAADPSDRRSRLALAEDLRALNRLDEAGQVLAALPGSDMHAQAIRAHLALDRNDLDAAEAILATGSADQPELAPIRGWLALARRDIPRAVREFRIAVAADPDNREILLGLGRAMRLQGDKVASESYLKAAASRDHLALLMRDFLTPGASRDPERLRALGGACEALGRFPEARAWFNLAYTYDPSPKTQAALRRLANHNADR
jgi:tetratricopeptide (TPR) repeat protein